MNAFISPINFRDMTKPSVFESNSAKKPYSAMLETLALWIELIGKESFMFSQGSLVSCFNPREILNFSLSKLGYF
jgi:hypothetical protein